MPRSRSSPSEVVARPPGEGTTRRRKRSRWRKLWLRTRWPLLGLGLLFVVGAIDVVARYLPAVQALQHGRSDVVMAQTLLTGDLGHLDKARVAQARSLLADAQQDFGARSAVLADGWIGGVAAQLPFAGKQVQAARLLRTAGEDGTVAGTNIVGLVEQLVPNGTATQPLFERLVTVAQEHRGDLVALSAELNTLQRDIASLPDGSLLGPLDGARQTLRTQASKVLSSAAPAIALLQALPAAIGPGQHTYVLLLENPGEMRPGGGYIGAIGQVTFTNGALTGQLFRGSEYFDPIVRDIQAPRPFNVYLQHNQPWNIGDADWSPDFPTAVRDVERFYVEATGVHLDGVIAVDPIALGGILSITGDITVPPYPQVITGANVLTELNYITNKARPQDPGKVFLPPFGQAVVDRLLHASIAQSQSIATSLQLSAQQKHIELFFSDPSLENLAAGAGFDGGVRAPLGDSLQIVDGNLSGTKGDLFVMRHFSLQSTVSDNGEGRNTLTLDYKAGTPTTAADKALVPNSGGEYRDYLQVLVPQTARFDGLTLSINGGAPLREGPEAITYDFQREDIAFFFLIPKGGTATLVLTYEGPFADISHSPTTYSLNWERQPGSLTWPIEVSVTMPKGGVRRWSSDLSVDRSWALTASG